MSALVSVIIPVYNGERFLAAAIESVLGQNHRPLEVLVVDDGSTDGSAAIARAFGPPVTCLGQANAGMGGARNSGVNASRGDFIAFLDADDLWAPDKLRSQLKRLAEEPELDCVFGLVDHLQEGVAGRFEMRVSQAAAALVPGAMLIRRDSFFKVGLFSTRHRVGEFIDWYSRAQEAGLRSEIVQRVVLQRRVHGDNVSIRRADARSDYLHILKAALDRRRGGAS